MRRLAFHRNSRGLLAIALAMLLFVPACKGLSDPTAPSSPSNVDGQNGNEFPTFSGTITLGGSAYAGIADGLTDTFVTAVVRDLTGNPVANGTPISFSTTMGTIRSLGSDPTTAGQAASAIVFNGTVAMAVRSENPGDALITAAIANVASTAMISFSRPQGNLFVSLVLSPAAGDTTTLEGNAPIDVPLTAEVVDDEGQPVSGQPVRFTITEDTTYSARLSGRNSSTDTTGQGYSVLTVTGVGRVLVEVEAVDEDGEAVATSNQVIVTTRAITETYAIDLTFDDDSTVRTESPGTFGIEAVIRDIRTGETLAGRRVEFEIVSDTATTDAAELALEGRTSTDSEGIAVNAITTYEADTIVVLVAKLVEGGETILSNTIILNVTP
jgi:adhesin/invasin